MSRFFINLICILLFAGMFQSCFRRYDRITHLSDDELEWITNRQEGEVWYFQSQDGRLDTVTIFEVLIHNDTNTINWDYFQHGATEYIAYGDVMFRNISGTMGDLFVIKEEQDEPILFRAGLFMRGMPARIPLNITTLQIDGITLDDIMFFDERVMAPVNEYNPPVPIMNYAWSKQYGLVQYTFQDGTVFNRIDLK